MTILDQKRVSEIIRILHNAYPRSHTMLDYKTPFEIMVATILAAQCTDERVNKITPHLFKKYKDAYGFSKAKQDILEQEIRSTGFYRNKAKNIIASSRRIVEKFNARVPDTMSELITLPGVARKTANIVLSSGFKKAEGIAVDTHVRRLSQRLGLTREDNPNKIEQDLMRFVPKKDWLDFNYMLVNHGREICKARRPLCAECVLSKLCPSAFKVNERWAYGTK